jgi:Cu/Ag efflux protein CusF
MSVPAQAADSHQGKVVETSAGQLVMTDQDGKNQHPMEVPASATVSRNGKEAKLTDLKAGDTITVTTDTKDGKSMVTKVEAKAAGM